MVGACASMGEGCLRMAGGCQGHGSSIGPAPDLRGGWLMSDEAYGSTIAKLRLAHRLAELRIEAGYTANHVCDMLNWGRGKVGRFEANQWRRPEMSDIRDLLRFYEADDFVTREIETLALKARIRPWWRDYQEIF